MQENDVSQIDFMKYNLMKFAQILDSLGKMVHDKGDSLSDAADMINSTTDIRIFIDHHKSSNLVVNKERFMVYDDKTPARRNTIEFRSSLPNKNDLTQQTEPTWKMTGKLKEQVVIDTNYIMHQNVTKTSSSPNKDEIKKERLDDTGSLHKRSASS